MPTTFLNLRAEKHMSSGMSSEIRSNFNGITGTAYFGPKRNGSYPACFVPEDKKFFDLPTSVQNKTLRAVRNALKKEIEDQRK